MMIRAFLAQHSSAFINSLCILEKEYIEYLLAIGCTYCEIYILTIWSESDMIQI